MATNNKPKLAAHECISEEALAHLKEYKYSSVDKSLISRYILKHYWNAFVELLPMWLAPNMVTLLGFFFILANVALLEIFMPDLLGPGPSWLYFSFASGLWMYSTMDNVDGKQARRTGTSSGLGELFDHGIDSLNCTLGSLLETAAMGFGATKTGAFTALVPCLPMFFSTWETYHTHTLYLGYFNGPTEGLIIACSIMIASGIYGPQIWSTPMLPFLSTYVPTDQFPLNLLPADFTFRDFWVPLLLVSFATAHVPACFINVARARRAKNLPVLPLLLEWTPMAIYTAAIAAWLGSPYTHIVSAQAGANSAASTSGGHLVLFCLTLSFVFGRMTTKIILAHLTRQPFPYWTVMLAPLLGGAALANAPLILPASWGVSEVPEWLELRYLQVYFVFAATVYGNWAVLVINAICRYLGINCLTIPSQKPEQRGSTESNGDVKKRV